MVTGKVIGFFRQHFPPKRKKKNAERKTKTRREIR
jgi:hypothetical protein